MSTRFPHILFAVEDVNICQSANWAPVIRRPCSRSLRMGLASQGELASVDSPSPFLWGSPARSHMQAGCGLNFSLSESMVSPFSLSFSPSFSPCLFLFLVFFLFLRLVVFDYKSKISLKLFELLHYFV